MKKRSIAIAGHRTSVSLEEPFWVALGDIAAANGQSIAALVTSVDHNRRSDLNLSAALRLHALAWYRERAGKCV